MCDFSKIFEKFFRYILFLIIAVVLLKYIIPRTSIYFRTDLFHPLFGVALNENDIVMITGEKKKISIRTINKLLKFSSTDFKVAFVNQFGIVCASRPGLCFIKVYVDEEVLKCRVRVIELNHTSLELTKGEHKWLNIRGCVFGESYSSSNTKVVKVSTFGRLTAVGAGTATITAKAFGRMITCNVVVTDNQ